MRSLFLTGLLILVVILTACKEDIEVHISGKPDAEEVLNLDPGANIFLWNNTVYQTNIDWVEKLTLTKNQELGEISSVSRSSDKKYKNGMANKLPLGVKIYSANERQDVLLVEKDGKLLK